MGVVYGSGKFFIDAGQTAGFTTAFNGDPTNGGDYMGPVVVCGVCDDLQQEVSVSPTNLRSISVDPNGLTSRVVYDYAVTNNNSAGVNVRLDKSYG
jgi:hypothetical protein